VDVLQTAVITSLFHAKNCPSGNFAERAKKSESLRSLTVAAKKR